jgi:hypothetical protein
LLAILLARAIHCKVSLLLFVNHGNFKSSGLALEFNSIYRAIQIRQRIVIALHHQKFSAFCKQNIGYASSRQ